MKMKFEVIIDGMSIIVHEIRLRGKRGGREIFKKRSIHFFTLPRYHRRIINVAREFPMWDRK